MGHANETPEGTWWIARPENANKVFYTLCGVCALLLLGDIIFLLYSRSAGNLGHLKGHFDFEDIPFFHGIYGFMAFVFVVLSGVQLRTVLMRPEDYYDIPYTPREDDHHDEHGHDDHGHDSHNHDEHAHEEHTHEEHAAQEAEEQTEAAEDTGAQSQESSAEDVDSTSEKDETSDAASQGGDEA